MRIPIALGAVAVLSACASSPNDISTAYVSAPDGGQDESDTGIALASVSKPYNPPNSSISGATTKALNNVDSGVQDAGYTLAAGAIWEAGGPSDGCGVPWRINVQQFGTEIRGNLWWWGMSYDLYGDIDDQDRALDAFASKSIESQNMPGPRIFKLEFDLKQDSATGYYAIDNQSKTCRTDFVLSRS